MNSFFIYADLNKKVMNNNYDNYLININVN